jgi:hypothetical protein
MTSTKLSKPIVASRVIVPLSAPSRYATRGMADMPHVSNDMQ